MRNSSIKQMLTHLKYLMNEEAHKNNDAEFIEYKKYFDTVNQTIVDMLEKRVKSDNRSKGTLDDCLNYVKQIMDNTEPYTNHNRVKKLFLQFFDLTHNNIIKLDFAGNRGGKRCWCYDSRIPYHSKEMNFIQLFTKNMENSQSMILQSGPSCLMLIPYQKNKENTSFSYYALFFTLTNEEVNYSFNPDKVNFTTFVDKIKEHYVQESTNHEKTPNSTIQELANIPHNQCNVLRSRL